MCMPKCFVSTIQPTVTEHCSAPDPGLAPGVWGGAGWVPAVRSPSLAGDRCVFRQQRSPEAGEADLVGGGQGFIEEVTIGQGLEMRS